jgi:anti-anti-sigma factor
VGSEQAGSVVGFGMPEVGGHRSGLTVHVDRVQGVMVISPVGEIDIVTGGLFLESMIAAVAAGESRLIVDLTRVPFMDSTGLAIFLSVERALRSVDGSLRLVATPKATDVLGISLVDGVFAIDDSVELAVGLAGSARAAAIDGLPRQD